MKYTTIFLLAFFLYQVVYAQHSTESLRDSISNNLLIQLNSYPQEKIHLHTDRDIYSPTERIWFKAYLVDSYHHQYIKQSRYVYVELISPADTLITRVMIAPQEDMYYGHIDIHRNTPEGYYTLCAYSKYMENQGKEYFFRKKIHIVPTVKLQGVNEQPQLVTLPERKDYEVYFFPEGGHLLAGEQNLVAFKALDEEGNADVISGEIVDSNGENILKVKTLHEGMGTFSFFCKAGETYILHCTNQRGITKTFELPAMQLRAHSLNCVTRKNTLFIRKRHAINTKLQEGYYLLVHCKGKLLYFNKWDKENTVAFQLNQLPPGVIQFLLLDEQLNTLSERLFFSKNQETTTVRFVPDKVSYNKRELITCELSVLNKEGISLPANLSVTITDNEDITYDSSSLSILTTLLLTSELNGYIASPGYYFEEESAERTQALDCLMLTHGWRRYNIPEVIKGNIQKPTIQAERSQIISGKVKSLIRSHPVVNADVQLLSYYGEIVGKAQTNENGRFVFTGFELPDSTVYIVQALSKKGRNTVELCLDETTFPLSNELSHQTENRSTPTNNSSNSPKRMQRELSYNEQMRVVQLEEVLITAKKFDKMKDKLPYFSSFSSWSLSGESIKRKRARMTYQLFYGMPRIRASATGEIGLFRKPVSFIEETTPMIYVDGMRMGRDFNINDIHPNDIYRIDVFNDDISLIAFAPSDRETGVISIVMKLPEDRDVSEMYNIKTLSPLGVQKPIAFYAPRYDTKTEDVKIADIRTTIFWKPDVITNEDSKATFDFYSADYYTTYTVIIEGLTKGGQIVRAVEKIQIEAEDKQSDT